MKSNKMSELQSDIIFLKTENPTFSSYDIAKTLGCDASYVRRTIRLLMPKENDNILKDSDTGEVLLTALDTEKKNQKLRDQQRIERKIRESYRFDNAIGEMVQNLVDIFKDKPKYDIIKHETIDSEYEGILQISDTHLNELINIESNKFDFSIAAKRLKKLVIETKRIFTIYGIQNVLIALEGDLLNSDRRLDELLNQATNRTKACVLSTILFEQVIIDMSQDFNITVASVSGNEGRVNQEYGSSEIVLSDNYDIMIAEMLKMTFRKNPEITFINSYCGESVVKVNGINVLLIHGNQIKANHMTSIQSIRGKYSDMGIKLGYVLYGHLHSSLITDFYARSSSLCGANSYSDNQLQFSSKAAQNIHIFGNSGDIHSIKIDLQNTQNIEGYEIDEELVAYNAKSHEKVAWKKIKTI